MGDKRQKNQLQMVLAFTDEGRSEAPTARREGTESLTAKRACESPAKLQQGMEEVCDRENLKRALQRVKSNKGSPGIDGMRVEQLPGYRKQHWPAIREQLLSGTYQPQAVRRVEIAKPDGGMRKLGIPTVLDRLRPGPPPDAPSAADETRDCVRRTFRSHRPCSTCITACWMNRSSTVGMPSLRIPPSGLAISTRLTACG